MSIAPLSSPAQRFQPSAVEPDENDQRLHRRFNVALGGRFMRANKEEFPCKVQDISVGGIALTVGEGIATTIEPGEKVIAYIEQIGGIEGPVLRTWRGGFAFKLNATQNKREKLAAQITWLLNETDLKGSAARQHERLRITNRDSVLTLNEGNFVPCLLLDVSMSGANIACRVRPEIGEQVWLARLRARVVRHHSEGIGVQFMEILDQETMQAYFG
jgi:PilZ domain